MKSDSEELNVDKEEDDECDANGDSRFGSAKMHSNQQADGRLNQQNSSPIKGDFKSIEELYKSSLIGHSNHLNGQPAQAQNQFASKPTNNSLLPSSPFLSNLSFPNHNPHFQALLASHLAPYSAFNFNSNSLYLNNLIHQGNLDNAAAAAAACQQAQQAQQATASSQHLLQSSASKLSLPSPACPPPSGYSTVLEDNLRQALLAAQSNPANPDTTTTTPKPGHSLNLISSSFNNHSGWWFF